MRSIISFIIFIFLIFSFRGYSQQTTAYYEQALLHFDQGNIKAAEIAVKNSIQENDAYLPARILLGNILLQSGQPAAAEKEFMIALSLNADQQAVIIPLAEAKALLNRHQEVLDLLARYPHLTHLPRFLMVQSASYRALKEYQLAENSLIKAKQIHGENEQIYTSLAELYFLQLDSARAQEYVRRALTLYPQHLPAQMLQAELLKAEDKLEEALNIYERILLISPDNQQALFGKAYIYLQQNALTSALDICLFLREKFPDDPYAKLLHASIVALHGDKSEAKMLLRDIQQQLLSLDNSQQKEQQVLLLSASVDLINENFNQARKQFTEYLSLYGESALARRHLAALELKLGNLASARNHIDKAIAISNNNVGPYLLAAEIYQRQGFANEYSVFIGSAYQRFPKNDVIKGLYVNNLIAKNDIDAAVSVLSTAVDIRNRTLLAYLQLQTSELEKSLVTTEQLLAQYPNKVEILQLAGELSLKLGQKQDAQQFFLRVVDLAPEFRPATLALAGMALNEGEADKAVNFYQQILKVDPSDALALQLYADLAIKEKQLTLAIELLSTVSEQEADFANVQRALLALYIETNQYQLATATLDKLEEYYSLDEEILLAKSKLMIETGRILVAKKSLNVLFGLVYDHPKKLESVALLQLQAQDTEGAIASIERIKQIDDNSVSDYLQARFYLAVEDFTHLQLLVEQHETTSSDAHVWQELEVHMLLKKKLPLQAIAPLAELFSHTKQRSHLQLLASLYAQTNQIPELIALLKNWLNSVPEDQWAVSQLSEIALAQGQDNLAIATLEGYPHLTEQPAFLNNLANLYLEKSPDKALVYAKQAYALQPNLAAINDTLGWTLVTQGKVKKGLYYLHEAASRNINHATYQYHLAYAQAKLSRIELAQMSYRKGKILDSEHNLATEVDMLIQEAKAASKAREATK